MSRLEQAKSTVYELQCLWRVAKRVDRFAKNRPWSASRLLDERVVEAPNNLAVAYLDERYTWRDVDRRVNQFARFFQSRGIGRGDVVAILMDNRPEFLFAVVALNRLRAIASLINTNATGHPLTHAISVCKAKGVFVGSEHSAALSEVLPTLSGVSDRVWMLQDKAGEQPAAKFESINEILLGQSDARPAGVAVPNSSEVMCYIYTSGTTGLPKAAIITNKRYLAAAYMFGGAAMDASERDIIYLPLPLYHSNAIIIGFGSALVSGATVALRRKFSASQFWDDVRKYDASIFIYIGELCRYLLNAPKSPNERNHRLRVAVGNGLRPDAWEAFQRRFGVPLIREFYAATEGNAPIINFEGRPGMLGGSSPARFWCAVTRLRATSCATRRTFATASMWDKRASCWATSTHC